MCMNRDVQKRLGNFYKSFKLLDMIFISKNCSFFVFFQNCKKNPRIVRALCSDKTSGYGTQYM